LPYTRVENREKHKKKYSELWACRIFLTLGMQDVREPVERKNASLATLSCIKRSG
jgi:hypothetical protein